MTLLAAFDASSPALALGPTLEALPSIEIELERQYALDPARPIAFCRMQYRDHEGLVRTLADDDTIDEFERLGETDRGVLYRLQRSETDVIDAYREWVDAGGELLACHGSNGSWAVEMRFPDRDAFGRYHEFLASEGVSIELQRLADGDDGGRCGSRSALTDAQREALTLAHEHGFFEVPRETELSEIAAELGISNQAVSERLRRGQAQLIADRLVE
ncbi:helix-turn-helix domain-containing protein [Natrinema gari]|uniref:Bacterio-opsin activator HTH domain protein n=1 Tax=Natrinema gari JCM 14663 TaxID=1230459 RepID=L9Z5L8_9EURY|nr:helix-turn-helix domain-containing protein [Natrinema gari]ELY81669.1 Bacterio-opsin activator HTH domain protein [Natrinema gari JCM 14663]